MFAKIDSLLDRVTMYRLAIYYLLFLCAWGLVLSFFGALNFSPQDLFISTLIIVTVTRVTSNLFSRLFRVDENPESSLITGLILALIINPDQSFAGSSFLFWALAGTLASASKYILAPFKKHIFNPAAFAVAATAVLIGQPAGWWVGTVSMLPPVFFGGLLLARKLLRKELVLSFLAVSLVMLYLKGGWNMIPQAMYSAPLFFFVFVMVSEPSTTPPGKGRRAAYGAIVGALSVYYTYEVALLIGNISSYLVSPKPRMILKLKTKKDIASGIREFSFVPLRKVTYFPGQYFEWTLDHKNSDSRGVRRYFTVASSPTEDEIKLGTKFAGEQSSSFKKALFAMEPGGRLSVSQLEGDFTMPVDTKQKLAFIAGGIGITPFRSMVKYMLDKNDKRDIVLFYSNKTDAEIAWKEIFEEARKLGINTIYINTDKNGFLDEKRILKEAPDFKERIFYISGPHGLVDTFETMLPKMGVPNSQIKTDFFPGYA